MNKTISLLIGALLLSSLTWAADASDPSDINPQGAGVSVVGSNTVKDVCDCNMSSSSILPKREYPNLLPDDGKAPAGQGDSAEGTH